MSHARLGAVLLAAALILSACGTASSTTSSSQVTSTPAPSTGVVTMLMQSWPTLDPATDSSTGAPARAEDVDWFVYTGLTTYSRAGNGAKLIPGLAKAMPLVLGDEDTYVATLRKRLVFSNGQPVMASDFLSTVERDLRIHQSAAVAEFANLVVGARQYEAGESKTVKGISVDNTTDTIVIKLRVPDKSFDRLLAVPALGLVPATTPDRVTTVIPAPGVGPYELTNLVPKSSFSVVQNPQWSSLAIPGLPAGHLNINVDVDRRLDTATKFTSVGIDASELVPRPSYGLDLTSLELDIG